MAMKKETIYLKAEQSVEVKQRDVTLGDIVKMECANPIVLPKLKTLKILSIPETGHHRYVISILKIIACIHEKYPMLEIQSLGEPDIILTYEDQNQENRLVKAVKIISVMAITFVGSAFSIISFHNDVSVTKLFSQIQESLTGSAASGFTILELSYSIGLVIGILVFFNHIGKKRFSVDPTPIEIEMRIYENDIQTTLIQEFDRKGKEMDVGQAGDTGSHRS